jgi:hypothetical protein
MAAAHVDPVNLLNELGKSLLHGTDDAFEHIAALFAKRMKVQALDATEVLATERIRANTETAAR